jgi:predicted permease
MATLDLGGELDPRLEGRNCMRLFTEARERLRALFFQEQHERELDEEMRFHLAMEIENNVRKGLDPAEARRQAAITFGGVERVKEEVRDARSFGLAEDLFADLKYALRGLRRGPLIPMLVVLSLAVGVAVNTTMFSAFDAFLLRPLPFQDPDRIVRVWLSDGENGRDLRGFSAAAFEHMRERSRAVDLAAYGAGGMNLTGIDAPERLQGLRVTANFFRVLAPIPLLGRTSFAEDEVESGAGIVVISQGFWNRHFGGDGRVLGEVLHLDGQPHTIVGVVGDEFLFPHRGLDIYTPLRFATADRPAPEALSVIGRLRPGVSIEAAGLELNQIGIESADEVLTHEGSAVALLRLDREMFNQAFRTATAICSVAVLFVLLIACSNAANLLLVRATKRQHEIAVRAALGAGRARVVRQLLTESLVLALAGGALGALLAYWGVQGLIVIVPADIPMVERIALDERALIFTLGVSLLAGILSGVAPALHNTGRGIGSLSRGAGGRGTIGGRKASRLRSSIVVGEIALAMVLLIGAGLLIKGYIRAMNPDIGFDTDDLVTMRVTLPEPAHAENVNTLEFLSRLATQLASVAGVQSVAISDALPLTDGGSSVRYATFGTRDSGSARAPEAELRSVATGYFDALQINVGQGREFTAEDRFGSPPVVIINAALARTHWVDRSPIGQLIEYDGRTSQVVGVVDDVNEWGAAAPPPRTIYAPLAQRPVHSVAIAVRSPLPMEILLPRVREAVGREDPNLPLTDIATMHTLIRDSQPRNRLLVRLLGAFAFVAAVLAVVGVYGVMAYNVAHRRSEVGLRVAVGAGPSDIVRLMLGHAARLAGAGILIGVAAALGVTRFLSAFMNGVSPFDMTIFSSVTGLLFSVAIVACLIPALRAARVTPLTALRTE